MILFDDNAQNNSVSLFNVTIAKNIADSDQDDVGDGGGIIIGPGPQSDGEIVTIRNSIIASNSDLSSGGGAFGLSRPHNCSGTFVSAGYNLISNAYGCNGFTDGVNGDIVGGAGLFAGVAAQLGDLDANGGQTKTHALLDGSPAIDAGNPNGCSDQNAAILGDDQRGFIRPADAGCDIGAYEYNAVEPTPTPNPSPGASPTSGPTATPTATPTIPPNCSAPETPILLEPFDKAKVKGKKITLSWSEDSCSSSYNVQVQNGKKENAKAIFKKSGLTVSSVKTKRLKPGKRYYWFVEGCDSSSCSKSALSKFKLSR